MRKIYLIFSFIWFLAFILILLNNTNNTKPKDIKSEEIIIFNFKSDIIFEVGNAFLKKSYYGKIYHEKPNNLAVYLKKDKDFMEIGSNKKYFWYFSSDEKTLYYGLISDVNFILKEIFNPSNIIQIIFPPVLIKDGLQEDELIGDYGDLLKRKIIIENYKIKEQKIYNNKNELIYEVKVNNYYKNIPSSIKLDYIKEGYFVNIKMNEIEINQPNNFIFDLPTKKYKKKEMLSP